MKINFFMTDDLSRALTSEEMAEKAARCADEGELSVSFLNARTKEIACNDDEPAIRVEDTDLLDTAQKSLSADADRLAWAKAFPYAVFDVR